MLLHSRSVLLFLSTFFFAVAASASCLPSSAGAKVCSPGSGSTVSSPVTIAAGAVPSTGRVSAIRVYLDNNAVYTSNNNGPSASYSIQPSINAASGTHSIVVVAYLSNGGSYNAGETFTVGQSSGGGSNGSCASVALQFAKGPTSGRAPFPPLAPQPPPNPGSNAAGSVCVQSPANGASVTSPFRIVAPAHLTGAIKFMRVYVDGLAEYFTFFNTVNAQMMLPAGAHTLEVLATDTNNRSVSTTIRVNVTNSQPQNPAVFTNIQQIPSWEGCSALFPPGHPRAGQICAAGLGNAASTMTENQSSPPPVSGSGSTVAHFTLGGPTHYTNELWTKYFASGANVTRFTYDMYVRVDDPTRPQALEFDVNQAFGNNRWIFGTECNFKGSGRPVGEWDVWDGIKGWQQTSIPCSPSQFPANTWVHLVWQFQRVGNQVHYISLSLGGTTYNLNKYYSYEPGWMMEDVDVAFQMDGNSSQQPYNVWLDRVTLTAR